MEPQLHSKTDALTERALRIYLATKHKKKKDVLIEALAAHIPPEIYEIARKEIEQETGMAA
jgi:hypothetical protein